MKKVLVVLVMFCVVLVTSCTDNTEENLVKKNEKKEEFKGYTDPSDNGTIKDTDPDDDGEI